MKEFFIILSAGVFARVFQLQQNMLVLRLRRTALDKDVKIVGISDPLSIGQ
jgi:hypothetical protein